MGNLNLRTNYIDMVNNIIEHGVAYFTNNPDLKTMVLGVSGGIDSALTAVLARRICDILGNVELLGIWLPMSGNESDEWDRADEIGSKVCNKFHTHTLDFLSLLDYVDIELRNKLTIIPAELSIEEKIRIGNVKARLRMIYLYNMAHKCNGLVLSTDNLTEYNLGFFTLHGDVGDLGLIQGLWKTEVYNVAEAIGGPISSCIEAKPTDGLGITDSDLDQLLPEWKGTYREGYRKIDEMLIDFINDSGDKVKPDHAVLQRHVATQFKRNNPYTFERDVVIACT